MAHSGHLSGESPSADGVAQLCLCLPQDGLKPTVDWHGVQRPSLFALRWNTCSWGATQAPRSLCDQGEARHQMKPPLYSAAPLPASPTFPWASPESILSINHLDENPCLRLCCQGTSPKAHEGSVWVSASLDRKWASWIYFHWWVCCTNTDGNFWVILHTSYLYPFPFCIF